jgi:hypothetical protein
VKPLAGWAFVAGVGSHCRGPYIPGAIRTAGQMRGGNLGPGFKVHHRSPSDRGESHRRQHPDELVEPSATEAGGAAIAAGAVVFQARSQAARPR